MKTLTEIQIELKAILPQGIDLTFQALKNSISEGTDCYNDMLLLESRYMDISRQLLQGTISNEDAQIEFNKVRKDLLVFIDGLQESHLKSATPAPGESDDRQDVYNGEVLYRIPKTMKKEEEVKCMVRLAFDRKVLVEDLEVQEEDVLKDIRISDVMGVELIDPSDGTAFAVRTINDTVQFVEKDLYTEWLFYVKPLAEGTHPLILKISVIEIRNGVERKRNVVLEETIEIVAGIPAKTEAAAAFVTSGYTVQYARKSEHPVPTQGAELPESAPPPPAAPTAGAPVATAPAPTRSGGPKKSGKARKVASALAVMVFLLTASWAIYMALNPSNGEQFTSVEKKDWDDIKSAPSRDDLRKYVVKYPESDYAAIAQAKLDSMENTVWNTALAANDLEAYERYIQTYPDGVYASRAMAMIAEIENEENVANEDERKTELEPERQRPQIRPAKPGSSNAGPRPAKPNRTLEKPKPSRETDKKVPETPAGTDKKKEEKPELKKDEPIPMRSASRLPVYPGCEKNDKDKEVRCTNQKIGSYISRKLKYPEEAKDREIEGTIEVHFVVEKDGSITDVTSINDIGGGCAEEAVRLVKQLPNFIPGQNRLGQPARIRYKLPISFKLR